ncbi:MAG: hypothetical protein N3A54_04330 [Patescibacteria group bacterium]|nr:hypothetical protein [Patescibacteria group bacterium]
MNTKELTLNGCIVENPNGPIVTTTYVFNGFLRKEDLEGTEFERQQIIYQHCPYDGKPETVVRVESVKPVITIRVIDDSYAT